MMSKIIMMLYATSAELYIADVVDVGGVDHTFYFWNNLMIVVVPFGREIIFVFFFLLLYTKLIIS